jgi:uncharacterized protein (TIGR03435 family)
MTKTQTIILVVVLVWVLAMAVAVKMVFFPAASDKWFVMDQRIVRQAPAGLVIIRPTHFSLSITRKGVIYAPPARGSDGPMRMMGRNVGLSNIVAVAYSEAADRVVMPFGAPTNNFDFIVTSTKPFLRLQKALTSQFGYTVDKETQDVDVLALKVKDPSLPGLTVSTPDEKENSSYKKGKLYLTHIRLKELAPGFEQILKTPVVDKTGLTNYYDFSLSWNRQLMTSLGKGSSARPAVDQILAAWGLDLEPDTASMEMLIVKKAY